MRQLKPERTMEGEELAFVQASGALFVKSLERTRSFAEALEDFRINLSLASLWPRLLRCHC